MLTAAAVYEKLMQITNTDESEKDALYPFCETAAAVINGKMRTDADASDIRLLIAAAATAYSRYLLFKNAEEGNITSIKAGDISVSKGAGSSSDCINDFLASAMEDAKELLTDTTFVFRAL